MNLVGQTRWLYSVLIVHLSHDAGRRWARSGIRSDTRYSTIEILRYQDALLDLLDPMVS